MEESVASDISFGDWDARYRDGETPWDTGRASSELMETVLQQRVLPCATLELGCGTGADAVFLASSSFQMTAVDCAAAAIDRAIARADKAQVRVRFRWADALDLPDDLKHPYGFVFDRRCYESLRNQHLDRYIATVERVTQAGSRFLLLAKCSEPDRDWFQSQPIENEPFGVSRDDIVRDFGSLFEFSWLRCFRFDGHDRQPRPCGWSCLMARI
jgi:ubiquinone/menaquinone biosynthesis C-methylase UbiE